MNMPHLTLSEGVPLAWIEEDPFVTNVDLEKVLSLSKTGVESLIRRLKRRDLIKQSRKGRARELFVKWFHMEPLTN